MNELGNLNGYYLGECTGNNKETHIDEVLVIANSKTGKWIEITALAGGLETVLRSNKETLSLLYAYSLISNLKY